MELSSDKLQHNIEKRAENDLQTGFVDAVSVAVMQHGRVIYENTFGKATKKSLYRLASMTKPITAVAILKLAERGLLCLEDPVIRFLPGQDPRLRITHLLTHTSGISRTDYEVNITDDIRKDSEMLTDYVSSVPINQEPGTHAEYSPLAAFALLTAVAERAATMDFASFVEKEIAIPCQMPDTTFFPTKQQWARLVPMDDTKPGCIFESYPITNPLGGAGLISSLQDYKNFAQMLLQKGSIFGKQILKEETVAAMTTPQVPETVQQGFWRWGYGVRVITGKDTLPVGAFGWSGAYGTHFWIDPANEIAAIYLKNSRLDGGSNAVSARRFEEDVYGSL